MARQASTSTRTITRAVRPNVGVKLRYQRQLLALIDEMGASVVYWLQAQYRDAPPRLAQDESPSRKINRELRKLAQRWLKRFDEMAPKIAEAYVKSAFKMTDTAFQAALKDAGFTVKFTMTPAMRDAFDASLAENVGLIKSIPLEYLQKVQGIVNRSYTTGRDLATMTLAIRKLYPQVQDRAVLIARDQSNKANSVVNRARQLELGITEAIWMHSAGGKTPRPSHVAANGERFEVAKGKLIDGEWIQPGELINCRCVSRPVLPGL